MNLRFLKLQESFVKSFIASKLKNCVKFVTFKIQWLWYTIFRLFAHYTYFLQLSAKSIFIILNTNVRKSPHVKKVQN